MNKLQTINYKIYPLPKTTLIRLKLLRQISCIQDQTTVKRTTVEGANSLKRHFLITIYRSNWFVIEVMIIALKVICKNNICK